MFKILVVEDNKVNQLVIGKMLEKQGFKPDIKDNGVEAVEAVRAQRYNLIFMDCQMPVMDGYSATAEIRALESDGKISKQTIVALTAHSMPSDRQKCLDAGMDDYMSKPIREDSLVEMVNKWLGKAAAQLHAEQENKAALKYINEPDLKKLNDMLGESISDLLDLYRSSMNELVEALSKAITEKDYAAILRSAHTIKSPSKQVGALQAAEKADEIEVIAKAQGDLQVVEVKFSVLRELLNNSIEELEEYNSKKRA